MRWRAAQRPLSYWAGASIRMTPLAWAARFFPSTKPTSRQRRTISANTSRNTPDYRNRPCRFLEKVEWFSSGS